MRFCENCGSQINDNDRTCPYCGAQAAGDFSTSDNQYTQQQNSNYGVQDYKVNDNVNQNNSQNYNRSQSYSTRQDYSNSQNYSNSLNNNNGQNNRSSRNYNNNPGYSNGQNYDSNQSSNNNNQSYTSLSNGQGYSSFGKSGITDDNGGINVQRLVGAAGLSGAFITSTVAGILLMLMGLGLFLLVATEGDYGIFVALIVMIALLPLNFFVIGQIMFLCNAAAKKQYLSTSGLTVMKIGVITMMVYEIIYTIIGIIYIFYWIGRVNKRIRYARQWGGYFLFDSASDLKQIRIWLWISLIIFIVIMVLDIISYGKASGIITSLKYMQRTESILNKNLSIYPVVMNFIKVGLMFIGCIAIFATGNAVADKTGFGMGMTIILVITILIRILFYIFTGASIISFNGKLMNARRIETQKQY